MEEIPVEKIAQQLRQKGLSLRTIGKIVNRSHEWVRQKTEGISTPRRAPKLGLLIGKQLVETGASLREAADLAGCAKSSLHRFVKKSKSEGQNGCD